MFWVSFERYIKSLLGDVAKLSFKDVCVLVLADLDYLDHTIFFVLLRQQAVPDLLYHFCGVCDQWNGGQYASTTHCMSRIVQVNTPCAFLLWTREKIPSVHFVYIYTPQVLQHQLVYLSFLLFLSHLLYLLILTCPRQQQIYISSIFSLFFSAFSFIPTLHVTKINVQLKNLLKMYSILNRMFIKTNCPKQI